VRAIRAVLRVVEAPFRWASGHIRDAALPWLRGAYLTIRYVDDYGTFPAIQFADRFPRLHIRKEPGARLVLRGPLLLRNNQEGKHPHSSIYLQQGARFEVNGPLHVGDDVRFLLAPRAVVVLEGAGPSPYGGPTYSGFQGRCVIQIKESLYMAKDVGISWNCEVMDSDWHPTDGKLESFPIVIGRHVWITPGAKILKGAQLGDDCVVGREALVIGGAYPPRTFIAGIPAKAKGPAPVWRYEWYET
jgi:hypothetical protein